MKNCNFTNDSKKVAIQGTVCYENGIPAKNAIVFLIAFVPYRCYRDKRKFRKKFCGYTTTNFNGQFDFVICDTRYYYKIQVFKNVETITNDVDYTINLD